MKAVLAASGGNRAMPREGTGGILRCHVAQKGYTSPRHTGSWDIGPAERSAPSRSTRDLIRVMPA